MLEAAILTFWNIANKNCDKTSGLSMKKHVVDQQWQQESTTDTVLAILALKGTANFHLDSKGLTHLNH